MFRFILKASTAFLFLTSTDLFAAAHDHHADGKHHAAVGRKYSRLPDSGRKSKAILKSEHGIRKIDYRAAPAPQLPSVVDWRPQFPAVYDQGQLGSCTANAAGGVVEFDQKREGAVPFMPSRLFIYYNERLLEGTVNEDSGASISDSVLALARYGVCHETPAGGAPYWPYSDQGTKFTKKPSAACYTDALKYKDLDNRNLASVKQDLTSLKAAIAQGPIVGGISVYESFESNAAAQTGMIPMPNTTTEQLLGGHALAFVGYDDSKQSFILRNSWGAGWGLKGYAYIPYAYLTNPDLASDFWKITSVGVVLPQPHK